MGLVNSIYKASQLNESKVSTRYITNLSAHIIYVNKLDSDQNNLVMIFGSGKESSNQKAIFYWVKHKYINNPVISKEELQQLFISKLNKNL